jgi:hypothetical protein
MIGVCFKKEVKMETMKNQIRNNQNVNGGGLAVNITGRYESNRKTLADLDGNKRTAGQVAQSLRRSGHKITATMVKRVCTEWHHAGFIPGRKGMARVYYTTLSNVEILDAIEELNKKEEELYNSVVTGFYYEWSFDYGGRYGKKRNYKVCRWYEGSELDKPRNLTNCTREEFDKSALYEGKEFFGWDEPSLDR